MLYTIIKENSYQDSINLMLLTNKISSFEGVAKSSIMMGTDANKDIMRNSGLLTPEAEKAKGSDMVIVIDTDQEAIVQDVMKEIEAFLSDLSVKNKDDGASQINQAKNWQEALEKLPDANLALISIPGIYAADEIEKALDNNLNVFCFSDNVSLEDEVRLKKKAHEKGLLLMGPDCGTGIISGIPLAFTNAVGQGNIGIVGASGTGIQEVTAMIDKLGGGVVHAIGTGGRDLKDQVGAITLMDAIIGLENHDQTEVIVVISKPPGKEVKEKVVRLLHDLSKPVVALFLGEKPSHHEGNVYFAYTLEEAARIAVDLAKGLEVKENYFGELDYPINERLSEDKRLIGLYSGGTLAAEAGIIVSEAFCLEEGSNKEGFVLDTEGIEIIDLGDDIYTQGKPHPMIDPDVRIKMIKEYSKDPKTGVILFDCVLGYGAHPDMANALAPVIKEAMDAAKDEGRSLYFIATVVGTKHDPQDYLKSVETLESVGVIVQESNVKAVQLALKLFGKELEIPGRKVFPFNEPKRPLPMLSPAVDELLNQSPRVINIGLKGFNESIAKHGGKSIQFNWKPVAGGNKKLIKILNELAKREEEINKSNEEVINRMKNSQPFLVDVVPAKTVIPELNNKVLLHAGPPITWDDMTGPMKGSCIGATLFEGWAETEEEAIAQLENGDISFIPCHHVNAVGPMGGITSANMPVLVVKNMVDGTVAYCTMNEGIGKVLRFGAYSQEVIDRLCWMRDVLGPVLGKALRKMKDGININVIIAKAITMGDEFHQRNIAASLLFLKEVTPLILSLEDVSNEMKQQVIRFLADTDQFFLNIMMATGKSIVDYARKIQKGTVVTTMTRNGKEFGIRISGMGDQWFTAPVNIPKGMYFTGFSEEDGNPDIGDSAITETVGVGGMTMIAAPGVTRFVGAGGFDSALAISNEMEEICISNNPNFAIPTWDFKGAPLGIDIRKVVETGITPLINTGIAHKIAGIGQIGAGTVRAPLACFEKALIAYAEKLGINVEE